MASLQEQVSGVCTLADAVVKNPSISISVDTVAEFGLSAFFESLLAPTPWPIGPIVWVYKIFKNKEKEYQEKERMLREVIRKQQAVINKLNEELARSRQQNANNCQEIENLKEMLEILEKTERKINAA